MRTLSERYDVLNVCKRTGDLPKEFGKLHPRLAGVIRRMVNRLPAARPTIIELMNDPVFCAVAADEGKDPLAARKRRPSLGSESMEGELQIRRGAQSAWKSHYIRLADFRLFVYKSRDERKARACYLLSECTIHAEKGHKDGLVVCVENDQLETLYLRLDSGAPRSDAWLGALAVSTRDCPSKSSIRTISL